MRKERPLFREEQRFRQRWALLLVAIAAASAWFSLARVVFANKGAGRKPVTAWLGAVVCLFVGVGMFMLLLSSRLVVEVHGNAIRFRYYPFHRRWHEIAGRDILKAEARTYRPILEYGGWGIRWGRGGKAYNVSGKRGVQLELASGKKVLFGSQQADELAEAIARISTGPGNARLSPS